mmetsp:Transcript_11112/g.27783  ORF Transcript_11112/g.27783 Transcript_11112/m.27783 type:complete len:512 (-) Transcript_11112:108-1643(-)
MIHYDNHGLNNIFNVFRMKGSVFPKSFFVALPCAVLTGLLRWLSDTLGGLEHITTDVFAQTTLWNSYLGLVGFLIVFRTSIAYSRFNEGCKNVHRMGAEWFEACSALVAFCRDSTASSELVNAFRYKTVLLFDLLHAVALAEIEDSCTKSSGEADPYRLHVLDATGIDRESMLALRETSSKVELVFQWIQQNIVDNTKTGVLTIAPPILSRVFQELAGGMSAFHDCACVSSIPFPFPYAQTCDLLLMVHWLLTPMICNQWVTVASWACLLSFLQVFIFWSLKFISVELENPFGKDANDINASSFRYHMSEHYLLLLQPSTQRVPELSASRLSTIMPTTHPDAAASDQSGSQAPVTRPECSSLLGVWEKLSGTTEVSQTVRKYRGGDLSQTQAITEQVTRDLPVLLSFAVSKSDSTKSAVLGETSDNGAGVFAVEDSGRSAWHRSASQPSPRPSGGTRAQASTEAGAPASAADSWAPGTRNGGYSSNSYITCCQPDTTCQVGQRVSEMEMRV